VQGPDALKLPAGVGVNSFKNFEPGKAKLFVATRVQKVRANRPSRPSPSQGYRSF
jgi:hypothetical protein